MPDSDALNGPTDGGSLLADLILGRVTPGEALTHLVEALHSTPDPDPDLCIAVGCGDLESLLMRHESALWPEIDRLARTDVRFRRALAAVWAYDSPEFERRTALLTELGESREVTITFTVAPEDFSDDPTLSWRAFDSDTNLSKRRLAAVLRSIADWLYREDA